MRYTVAVQQIRIHGEYITLGQLLKLAGEVATGGEVKDYLGEESPLVNGEKENRRGRKLRPGDVVEFKSAGRVELI
jgi:ribosome-associated protein